MKHPTKGWELNCSREHFRKKKRKQQTIRNIQLEYVFVHLINEKDQFIYMITSIQSEKYRDITSYKW